MKNKIVIAIAIVWTVAAVSVGVYEGHKVSVKNTAKTAVVTQTQAPKTANNN